VKKLLIAGTALVASAGLLVACGGSSSKSSKSKSSSTTSKASTATSAPASTAAGPATVKTGQTGIGTVLTDADGKTLYLFANDQGTTSAVPANIQAAWPPLTVTGAPVAGDGVDASKLTAAPQPNGQTWATYNGHLLYRFSGDMSPGQTNGHKLGNVWYAIGPQGDPLM
jgi:predicted lipoprotein with Yx(FWY)xxD motif